MDKTILTLDQNDNDNRIDTSLRSDYRIRHAARAVVTDSDGGVALLHARVRDYYKLPGGGIDDNEDIKTALARELIEEIGSTANIIEELGKIVEWRDWNKLKQISYCFKAVLIGGKGTPAFTQEEIDEGFEVVWTHSIDEALMLVGSGIDSEDIHVKFMTVRDKAILQAANQ